MPYSESPRPAAQTGFSLRAAQTGSSLLETLIASGMLLVIAVAIFPMFHHAVANNVSGSESTLATQHTRTEIEDLFAVPLENELFDMENPLPDHTVESAGLIGDQMILGTVYWDPDANITPSTDPYDVTIPIAPGAWIDDDLTADGIVRWERTTTIRQYSYADIAGGVIDVSTGTQLITLGHPMLFDYPLAKDAPEAQIHFREEEVEMESRRVGKPGFITKFIRSM